MPQVIPGDNTRMGSNVTRNGCLVGLASVGHHSWQFSKDLLDEGKPLNFFYGYMWVVGRSIEDAYNMIFHEALKGNYEYVFLKEEDTIAPPEAFLLMLNKMRYNPAIGAITAVYPRKGGADPTPFFYRGNGRGSYLDWKWGEFFQVYQIPFGCTIMRTSDLRKMAALAEDSWIEHFPGPGQRTKVKALCRMVVPLVNEDGQVTSLMSQDVYWSELATKAGVTLYVDSSVNCKHVDIVSGAEYQVPFDLHDPKFQPAEGLVAASVGGGMDRTLVHGIPPKRIDWREETDPDIRADLRDMSGVPSAVYDYTRCFNALPFFSTADARQILREVVRITKPGGEIQIAVPDMLAQMAMLEAGDNQPAQWAAIYGEANRYLSGYSPARLAEWLAEEGCQGKILRKDDGLEKKMYVRAWKEPLFVWQEDWLKVPKAGWDVFRFFNDDGEE